MHLTLLALLPFFMELLKKRTTKNHFDSRLATITTLTHSPPPSDRLHPHSRLLPFPLCSSIKDCVNGAHSHAHYPAHHKGVAIRPLRLLFLVSTINKCCTPHPRKNTACTPLPSLVYPANDSVILSGNICIKL